MDALATAGLGLDYDTVAIEPTTDAWVAAGATLRDGVAELLIGVAVGVEPIGSSSVSGLLAKPIIDLAVGIRAEEDLAPIDHRLRSAGWIYRGDAGEDGGHLFVFETRPWHRVAHLHVVDHDGPQWRNYLSLRDLLRRSPSARRTYEAVKIRLAEDHPGDREAYTRGKSDVVRSLLTEAGSE